MLICQKLIISAIELYEKKKTQVQQVHFQFLKQINDLFLKFGKNHVLEFFLVEYSVVVIIKIQDFLIKSYQYKKVMSAKKY